MMMYRRLWGVLRRYLSQLAWSGKVIHSVSNNPAKIGYISVLCNVS